MNAQHYAYCAIWSPEDHQFVGLCEELPSLSWLASSRHKALAGIAKVVSEVVADLQERGEPVPLSLAHT